jgi:hypothetical protein
VATRRLEMDTVSVAEAMRMVWGVDGAWEGVRGMVVHLEG